MSTFIDKIILSDRAIDKKILPSNTDVFVVSAYTVGEFNGNDKVVAIVGPRIMAKKCVNMSFPSLKLFQLTSAGFDGVPCEVYASKGVAVANAGSVYSVPIAETVVFGMLQVAKRLRKNPNNRRFKLTRGYRYITELADKNVLVMGAGNIGTAVAERLVGFNVNVDGYDPYCPEKKPYKCLLRSRDELIENLGKYDYIVSALPDNEQTKQFINKELFDVMKKNAVIVNVGRKAVFDEDALYGALKSKRIGGAVLDMFEKFPNPITNKFRRLKNVIVLPGVSAISAELSERLESHIVRNVSAVLSGNKPSCVVNGGK